MKKHSLLTTAIVTTLFVAPLLTPAVACTGITLTSSDSAFVTARTIEWGESKLNSELVSVGRSAVPNSPTVAHVTTNTYGYVGIAIENTDFVVEGLNEKGLSAGLFFFPGYGDYGTAKKGEVVIGDMQLVSWLLGNFSNVAEVKHALQNVRLQSSVKGAGTVHFRVLDATGAQIVIEAIDGKLTVMDNPVGVLTNSPDFKWQMTNLNNYVNLKTGSATATEWGKVQLKAFGAGAGLMGLPGDITPPSRFVRAALMQNSMPEALTTDETVLYAFKILNAFEIPIGLELPDTKTKTPLLSAVQWTSGSDLTNKVFYFRTHDDSQIRRIDLKTIDFKQPVRIHKPLEVTDGATIRDLKL
jgi:choloylglycine hydrolase